MLFYLNEMAADAKRQRKGQKGDKGSITGGKTVSPGHKVYYLADYSNEEVNALFGGSIGRRVDQRLGGGKKHQIQG